MRFVGKLLPGAALLLAIPTAVQAQETNENERLREVVVEAEADPEEKTISGVNNIPLQNFPGAATVIGPKKIEELRPLSTADVLQTVPGLNVTTEDGRGLRPNIGIRGIDPDRSREGVLITADGVPIQPAVYGDKSAYYNVPPENIERIEVIKGASSVLYGPGNVGGVVNYVTKRPPAEPGKELTFRETVRQGGLFESSAAYGVTGENGVGARFSYINKTGETVRENTDTSVNDANLRVIVPTDNDGELSVRFNWYLEDVNTPGGLPSDVFKRDPDESIRSHDVFKGQRLGFDANYVQPIGQLVLDTLLYANAFERNWYLADGPDGTIDTNTQYIRDFVVTGIEPRVRWAGWIFGSRLHYERLDDLNRKGATIDARDGLTTSDAELDTVAVATYVQKELELFDGFVLTPGVRYEHVEQNRETGLRQDPELGPVKGESGRAITNEVVGGVHFSWTVVENGNVYGGVGRSFEPPAFNEAIDPTSGTDRDLDAEIGMTYEVGYRHQLNDRLYADGAVFLLDYDDKIISEAGVLRNAGETRTYGGELAVGAQILDNVSADLAVTLLDTEFRGGPNDGNETPMAPNARLAWGVSYRPLEPLTLRVDGFYVGEQFTDAANTKEESEDGGKGELPSYDVWNLRAEWNLGRALDALDLRLFAGVANIFDEEYRERRQASMNGIIPGLTRSAYAGIEGRF